jgi:hypothetical protein
MVESSWDFLSLIILTCRGRLPVIQAGVTYPGASPETIAKGCALVLRSSLNENLGDAAADVLSRDLIGTGLLADRSAPTSLLSEDESERSADLSISQS